MGGADDSLLTPGPEREATIARMVFETLDAGIVVQGPLGRVAVANPAAARILGIEVDDMINHRLEDRIGPFVRPDGTPMASEELPGRLAFSTGVAQRDVLVGLSGAEGATRWLEVSASPLLYGDQVFAVVSSIRDVSTRQRAEEALAHQARHDPITGLPNRRLLTDRLDHALARAERHGRHVAVLFYDVDHFKIVNDSLGHPAGDVVLQELAGRFRAGARDSDTVVRFGGDEFVIVCEDLDDVDQALEIAGRLTAIVEQPLRIDRAERIVTMSAGVAISAPGVTSSTLLRDADAAMNHAKERGRARTEVFSGELRSRATRRLDLDTALRLALDHDDLRLVYQPVMALATGRPVGCEALLRWDHPELGAISPDEFIPLAEHSGLIVPMGSWVLRRALGQLAAWDDAGPADGERLWMAVNLSARQLADPDLVVVITEALAAAGVDPARLHLEVTESVLIDDLPTTIERLDQLQSLGVHIDVDDFGTGYSSLSYLKRLPINTLKIDRSFTDGLGTDPHDTSIVHAIISLARALDLDVIAEGVETATQLTELEQLGCDLGQGYHWSRPLPPDELERWLIDHADPAREL